MKQFLLVAVPVALLSACASSGPQTAWGKPDVSKVDYVMDLGTCTGMAAKSNSGNGANTAGGINGQNSSAPSQSGAEAGKSSGQSAGTGGGTNSAPSGAAFPTGGSGLYRDSADPDMVQRAATQQRSQEMATKRAQAEAFKSCYVQRGYKEFTLTPEQRQHLATLKQGSNEYLEYLAKIGADPTVLKNQAK